MVDLVRHAADATLGASLSMVDHARHAADATLLSPLTVTPPVCPTRRSKLAVGTRPPLRGFQLVRHATTTLPNPVALFKLEVGDTLVARGPHFHVADATTAPWPLTCRVNVSV